MAIRDIQFQLTTNCNERCIFCRKYTWPNKELSIEKIKEMLEKYPEAKLQFSGGEPTMYSNLKELNDLLVGRTYKVYTNGAVSSSNREAIKFLINAEEVAISFDAAHPDKYNKVRRPLDSNAFGQVISTAIKLKNKCKLSMVVTRENVFEIPEILHFAARYKIKTRFYPLHTNTDDLIVLDCQLEQLKSMLVPSECDPKITNVASIFEKGYFSIEPKPFVRCKARNVHRLIDEYGREYTCCYAINDNGLDICGEFHIENPGLEIPEGIEFKYCDKCSRYRNYNTTGNVPKFM